MADQNLLQQSSRVAFAGLIHDIGKFAERARIPVEDKTLENNKQMYCRRNKKGQSSQDFYYSHIHAAYTGIAIDLIEPHLPKLTGFDMSPFAGWKDQNMDDSLINAAAMHHSPKTFLQWVIATADRVSSGFDREKFESYNSAEEKTATGKNHYTARQLTIFEQIRLEGDSGKNSKANLKYRYPLKPLSPKNLFPVLAEGYETNDNEASQKEYKRLWDKFGEMITEIPEPHRVRLPLWLDHFETLWGLVTHAIPSATAFNTKPDVSLYDHSRVVAALATALWRYHRTNDPEAALLSLKNDWDEKKFLLIQSDFYGIQDFIFTSGGEAQTYAAKLIRGRSFYVSTLSECAALRILEELSLPSTSQVINAAGKFLIIAPNTPQVHESLTQIKQEFDQWFLKHTWGQAGIGITWQPASCNDFERSRYKELNNRLFDDLENAKFQRLNMCDASTPRIFDAFLNEFNNELGVCKIDGKSPAVKKKNGLPISQLASDQIDVGKYLTTYQRILITQQSLDEQTPTIDLFGFYLNFTGEQCITGKFAQEAKKGNLLRAWDFSLPKSSDDPLWKGYARRNINAYIPLFGELSEEDMQRYSTIKEDDEIRPQAPKTFNYIAYDNKLRDEQSQKWKGIEALMTLKGDVDNLGTIFQSGMGEFTFAKMASLSRQLNNFFAIYLPWLCASEAQFKSTYTIFAGGDDFFMLGPWYSQLLLAERMNTIFADYVAQNPEVHFSAGLSITKPGLPVSSVAVLAEDTLEKAKGYSPKEDSIKSKNAVTCYNQPMTWSEFSQLLKKKERFSELVQKVNLSTGYIYGLLHLVDMAENVNIKPENAIWYSLFAYSTRRMLERNRNLDKSKQDQMQAEFTEQLVIEGIQEHSSNYRTVLFTHMYQHRS